MLEQLYQPHVSMKELLINSTSGFDSAFVSDFGDNFRFAKAFRIKLVYYEAEVIQISNNWGNSQHHKYNEIIP